MRPGLPPCGHHSPGLGWVPPVPSLSLLTATASACLAARVGAARGLTLKPESPPPTPTWLLSGQECTRHGLLLADTTVASPGEDGRDGSHALRTEWPWSLGGGELSLLIPDARNNQNRHCALSNRAHCSVPGAGWLQRRTALFSHCFANA